jgi:nucleoside phosphorylase
VKRQRQLSGTVYAPEVFIGRIGSGNGVMKSGVDRDRIATEHNMVAFEMEGVGAWDEIPCMLVKGLCDYADSHKNKDWQDYAAATAASVARAIIDRYMVDNVVSSVINDEVESHR